MRKIFLNSATDLPNLLFNGLAIQSLKGVLVSSIVIVAMTFIFEGVKILRTYVRLRSRSLAVSSGKDSDSSGSGSEVISLNAELIVSPAPPSLREIRRKKIALLVLEAALHALTVTFDHAFMLLKMTYSVHFLIAILTGSTASFFISQPVHEHLASTLRPQNTSDDHPSTEDVVRPRDRLSSISSSRSRKGHTLEQETAMT